jgi:uncharacterized damage-inducible protein DinB
MNKLFVVIALGFLMAIPAAAQMAQQQPSANPMSTWLRNAYTNNRNYILKSAEKMPEENYSMRPGPQMEVRTFGQILGHIADANYMFCSQAKGEKNPNQGTDTEKLTSKAALVGALTNAFNYCDGVYAALTDASGLEVITITRGNGQQAQVPRMAPLVMNLGHNNEHYGNIVTYLRIKSIVPASSEPKPQQPPPQH